MRAACCRSVRAALAAALLAGGAAVPARAAVAPTQPDDGTRSNVYAFGAAAFLGANRTTLNRPVVGMAATRSHGGYWLAASDGGVFAFGDAVFFGSTGGIRLNRPIVGMAATPSGGGYWLVASDGGIFAFGDAGFFGSTGGVRLNRPIVGMAATPSGGGYWLVASDGGVFAFGDAPFLGSLGGITLNRPIVGMAAAATGGYWLVASDGGIFAFGGAGFFGSTGSLRLARPIVGMAATATGAGYWMVASDGGMFAFGAAPFYGSIPGERYAPTDVTGMAARGDGTGYWVSTAQPVPSARFELSAHAIDGALAARMHASWRPGCPVGLESLRYLSVRHWGFDGKAHTGELVVHADAVGAMQSVLRALWDVHFPIERMDLVDNFGGHDDASMAANNTSAFNCRFVAGTSRWSEHAYGRAIDINTVQNPYVSGAHVSPPAGAAYVNRTLQAPGMIHAGDAVVRAFAAAGWGWGGNFGSAKDYQHFSATGR
ncbi:MAG: M15 family metallopeptidase [Acidimicrobiia bacterium]